jgi:macrolide transport system ATP-binding/permease protein
MSFPSSASPSAAVGTPRGAARSTAAAAASVPDVSSAPAAASVPVAASPVVSSSVADASLHLRADGISLSFGAQRVLTDVSFVLPAGTPTGLLGENGSGKSTLLRVLAGDLTPDAGTFTVPEPVGLLHQDLPFASSATVGDVVDDALERSRALERELERAGEALAADDAGTSGSGADNTRASGTDASDTGTSGTGISPAARYDELLTWATIADVWDAPRRAERVLDGLHLSTLPRARRLDEISGGQRERLALARLLIARPTTLLLDEPTNHLDDAGADFLAAMLASHPGPVLVASHDRAFLDAATVAQLDLDPAPTALEQEYGGVSAYTGTFTDYLMARMDARERWEKQFATEQAELRELETTVQDAHTVGHPGRGPRTEAKMAKKFYSDKNATVVSRRVRDAERRLEDLRAAQIRKPPAELAFTGIPMGRDGVAEVMASASRVRVDGRLAPTSFALSRGEKLLVTGPNGSGKSTLMAVLAGLLTPDAGTVSTVGPRRIGYLRQDEDLDPDQYVRAYLNGQGSADAPHADPHRTPALFGLVHPRDLDRPIGELSRGQQRRVALAGILADPPELLLLDEPTNHLALDVATRLEVAVQDWGGTVVLASHDRWLRRRWRGRTLEVGE